jgi:hypothetical protein
MVGKNLPMNFLNIANVNNQMNFKFGTIADKLRKNQSQKS